MVTARQDSEPGRHLKAGIPLPPRRRRTASFWEPIFDSEEENPFPPHAWNFEHTGAPTHVTFTGSDLSSAMEAGGRPYFSEIRFVKCDFSGIFDLSPREIVFRHCYFVGCDFGLSTWKRAKFSNCSFDLSSLSQTQWIECDFRACTWNKIGMSGNETVFTSTTITNPGTFIRSAYTNLEQVVLAHRGIRADYQKMRLESTKATVARALSRMYVDYGDERAFYDALRTSSNQSTRAHIFETFYRLKTGDLGERCKAAPILAFDLVDWAILNVAGAVNAWGMSIARPALIGLAIIFVFSSLYAVSDSSLRWPMAFIKAVEVTLLIGYTNHSGPSVSFGIHCLVLVNMLAGLLWYVVFIPTLVNRISRVR